MTIGARMRLLVGLLAWRDHDAGPNPKPDCRLLTTGDELEVVALKDRSAVVRGADGLKWRIPVGFLGEREIEQRAK